MKTKLITFLLFGVSLPAAQFLVTFNTAALNTQAGMIDIQFNPGAFPAVYEAGTATITAFDLGGGSLGSISSGPDGGASGTLPGPLVIVNPDFFNGIGYNATFGNFASFLVDFSGNAYSAPGQTILTTLSISLIGTTTISAVADLLGDNLLDVSFSSPGVNFTEIPEPATFGLMTLGLAGGAFLRRRSS